jgi:muramoyltetrapeptide carboxypeptidase
LKPPRLEPGDTIAVAAPGSAPSDPSRLSQGIAVLRSRGYRVVTARTDFGPHGYLSGPDDVRLAEFNGFLRRDDVQAIFCVRGGYGTLRLLPHLDYESARRHPKLVVGYSDITALHMALFHRAGIAGIAGPMVAVEWADPDPETERLFWPLVRGETPQPLEGPHGARLVPVRPGRARGFLVGGNLTLVTRLLGSPYLPPLNETLLFLEEVGEPPYRIDGMFAQLRLAGVLDRLGGLILGSFTETETDRPTLSLDDVFGEYLANLPFPVASGLAYGHHPVKSSIPVGVMAELDVRAESATLSVLESVVGG